MSDNLKYLPSHKGQTGTEEALQVACASYLRLNRIRFFHCPNGGNRDAVTGAKLKAQGVQRGVPDLIITDLLLVVELKVGSNKPTPEQIEWMENYRAIGWGAWWVNSLDEFIALIKQLKQ